MRITECILNSLFILLLWQSLLEWKRFSPWILLFLLYWRFFHQRKKSQQSLENCFPKIKILQLQNSCSLRNFKVLCSLLAKITLKSSIKYNLTSFTTTAQIKTLPHQLKYSLFRCWSNESNYNESQSSSSAPLQLGWRCSSGWKRKAQSPSGWYWSPPLINTGHREGKQPGILYCLQELHAEHRVHTNAAAGLARFSCKASPSHIKSDEIINLFLLALSIL